MTYTMVPTARRHLPAAGHRTTCAMHGNGRRHGPIKRHGLCAACLVHLDRIERANALGRRYVAMRPDPAHVAVTQADTRPRTPVRDGARVMRDFRARHQLTQSDVERAVGVSAGYVWKVESGRGPLTFAMRRRIETTFGVPMIVEEARAA